MKKNVLKVIKQKLANEKQISYFVPASSLFTMYMLLPSGE